MSHHVDQVCARALLLSPANTVLLMQVAGLRGSLWITPGGRLEGGESPRQALAREAYEELGLRVCEPEAEVWIRHAPVQLEGREGTEREHFFLVRTPEFEPRPADMGTAEAQRFMRFRWWPVDEIDASEAAFSPARLGVLLGDLLREGPPPEPIETGP